MRYVERLPFFSFFENELWVYSEYTTPSPSFVFPHKKIKQNGTKQISLSEPTCSNHHSSCTTVLWVSLLSHRDVHSDRLRPDQIDRVWPDPVTGKDEKATWHLDRTRLIRFGFGPKTWFEISLVFKRLRIYLYDIQIERNMF